MCTKDLSIHTINTRPSQIVLVIISFRACFNVFFMQHLHERYGLSCQPSTNKGMYNVKLNCVFGSVELLQYYTSSTRVQYLDLVFLLAAKLVIQGIRH